MNISTIRTTLAIPEDILKATDNIISKGKVKSRNEFVTIALRNQLKVMEKADIDEQLKEMVMDEDYRQKVLKMEEEFACASWEALQIGD
jgi:metal-responsive CopG/Arc/MetJ family transcriptional regulator